MNIGDKLGASVEDLRGSSDPIYYGLVALCACQVLDIAYPKDPIQTLPSPNSRPV